MLGTSDLDFSLLGDDHLPYLVSIHPPPNTSEHAWDRKTPSYSRRLLEDPVRAAAFGEAIREIDDSHMCLDGSSAYFHLHFNLSYLLSLYFPINSWTPQSPHITCQTVALIRSRAVWW